MTAAVVKGHGLPGPEKAGLEKLPKAKLIAMILEQREDTRIRLEEKDQQITELSEQLAKLQGETDKEKAEQKIKDINKHANQPTSKKPEWDKDGNPKPATKRQKKNTNKKKSSIHYPAVDPALHHLCLWWILFRPIHRPERRQIRHEQVVRGQARKRPVD